MDRQREGHLVNVARGDHHLCRLVATVFLLAWGLGSARADLPSKVIDVGALPDADPHVAFGAGAEMLVAYRHGGEDTLKLAEVACEGVTLRTLAGGDSPGLTPSLMTDTLGLVSVVHRADGASPPGLRFTLDGGELYGGLRTVPKPPADQGGQPVYALDSHDRPFVAFRSSQDLPAVAAFDIMAGEWVVDTVAQTPLGGGPSARLITIAINGEDQPVVAYYDIFDRIVVATHAGGGWSIRTHELDDPPAYEGGLTLAFDSIDAPHVACATSEGLLVLRFGIFDVTGQLAALGALGVSPHAMAIDPANRSRIAYYNFADQSIYVAENDFGWTTTLVAATDGAGLPSLALDPQGRWAVAYYDDNHQLIAVAGWAVEQGIAGDFDCDGDVDLVDFAWLQSCFTGYDADPSDAPCYAADLDGGYDVDLDDYALFRANLDGP